MLLGLGIPITFIAGELSRLGEPFHRGIGQQEPEGDFAAGTAPALADRQWLAESLLSLTHCPAPSEDVRSLNIRIPWEEGVNFLDEFWSLDEAEIQDALTE